MSASFSNHITSEYGYHGDDLQIHLHIMNNEDHQEPMDGPLAAVINGPIPHFLWARSQLQGVEGHWTLFSVTMMSFKNLFTRCHNCYGYYQQLTKTG